MAIPHAQPGEVIDVRPLAERLAQAKTTTLAKSDQLELIRLVVPAGKAIPAHTVAGAVTIQCLEGRVEIQAYDHVRDLAPGQMLYLAGGEPHAVKGLEDSSALVTIQLPASNR
jgi:quercetin dioxygenase-like cupin family protein